MSCNHDTLILGPSTHASSAGFQRLTGVQRSAAATTSGNVKSVKEKDIIPSSTFPGPLLLPEDDLSNDPRYPPQSLRSWIRSKDRNEVTTEQNTIYVAAPPKIDSSASFMQTWSQLNKKGYQPSGVASPVIEDVLDYLAAFYTGMTVKRISSPRVAFQSWDTDKVSTSSKSKPSKKTIPSHVGLNIGSEIVGIRSRPSPDSVFPAQLNLDDFLDAAITILPEDAYCLILLVNQDLFEDDDDVFVCGRAYGGSRVAVISTARYNPDLDATQGVEHEHAWPASHCETYVQSCISDHSASHPKKKKPKTDKATPSQHRSGSPSFHKTSPIYSALTSYKEAPPPGSSPSTLSGLWLGRVCRTASHELGHCFGMDHCVYYACMMQSSSSLPEDARQPPYLCPVDLAKVLRASGATEEAHYRALLLFCQKHPDAQMFAALAGWIRARLSEISR